LATSALALAGIDAFYGDSHVLHGVSFALEPGRLLGLLGRNGAGKSTSMNVAIGLLAPERISQEGVALVPQGRRIFKSLSVRENLVVAERKPEGGRAPAWSLDRVFQTFPRLEERKTQLAGHLSGGEQQMLAIGRALMNNPRILLMDEPSEGLAPQIVAEVERTIARLKAEGLSIVLVEQNVALTLEIADDAVVMNSGSVVYAGTAADLQANDALIAQHLGVH
jgi:branched-chain amino acid transport system ATP-binding protein